MTQARKLSDLGLTARGGENPVITGLCVDSRAVTAGNLFAALPGAVIHGAEYIRAAVARGATAILTDAEGAAIAKADIAPAALIVAQDPRQALAYTAALWFGAQPETMVAVTGTNGKSTVGRMIAHVLQAEGRAVGLTNTSGVSGSASLTPASSPAPARSKASSN